MSLVPYPGKLFFSGWSSRFGILTSLLKIRLFCKLIQKLICSECFVEIQSYSINPLVKILLMPLFLAHIIYSAGFRFKWRKSFIKFPILTILFDFRGLHFSLIFQVGFFVSISFTFGERERHSLELAFFHWLLLSRGLGRQCCQCCLIWRESTEALQDLWLNLVSPS